MIDYQEDQVVAFAIDCDKLLRPDSGRVGVNCARMQWDACNGMGYEKSRAKHLAELQAEVGPHPPPPPHGPFKPAPRFWKGQMCGLRIAGLPPIDGGAADPSLFLSWMYDRYDAPTRARIRNLMRWKYTHWLLSWPDSRDVGASPLSFLSTCQELISDGFYPCVMLCSKDHDPPDVPTIVNALTPVLGLLVGVVPMFSVGWELSLWLTPTQVQQLIDTISPICLQQAGTLVYVHFQQRYMSFPPPNTDNATFWRQQVGKLTGVLAQKRLTDTDAEFLDWIHDCLARFCGGFNMPTGFDFVMLEISAEAQFNGSCSEAEGDRLGRLAINAPKVGGVGVSGSGNGL